MKGGEIDERVLGIQEAVWPSALAGSGRDSEPALGLVVGWPGQSERKEWLEALKKHLEERLDEVNEELKKLEE